MLVLTRKQQEKIRIGDNIVVTVLKSKGKTVRLGIEAPMEVPVIRGELTFEDRAAKWEPESGGVAAQTHTQVNRVDATWPVRPERVTLQRVPREQMSQIVPRLATESGPLRAMLDQRSATV